LRADEQLRLAFLAMKILVTGGTSLLGGTVAQQLESRGHDITCFQRRSNPWGLRDVLGDIRDRDQVIGAVASHDAVVHLAALVAPKPRWADAFAVNVTGTENILAAASNTGRLVHVSTPSVAFGDRPAMGEAVGLPDYRGKDAYAHTKAIAERLVLERTAVPTVVIRPHLVWGPGDAQLVGRVVVRARRGAVVLPDHGRALIDTTYIDDAAAAIVAAFENATAGNEATGRAWVVTGGDPRPLAELLGGIVQAAGLDVRPRSLPAPLVGRLGRWCEALWPGDEPPLTYFAARQLSLAHWFDQRETRRVLSWQPEVDVDEGLRRLTEWFGRQPG
jgi:nucleoside-diphosphate-sugar epimerase